MSGCLHNTKQQDIFPFGREIHVWLDGLTGPGKGREFLVKDPCQNARLAR